MHKTKTHIIRIFTLLLLLMVGMGNEAWAYKVTYHILTLPMTSDRPGNTVSTYYNWRMEALRVIVDNVNTLQPLPAHFQSPLAKEFKYYASGSVTQLEGGAKQIYANHSQNKYYLYKIKGEDTPADDSDDQMPMSIGDAITSDRDIYVTYEYDEDNTIAKLDGSEIYNIVINGGFLAFNKGRNNRLAVIPEKYNDEYIVSGEQLCSDDFVKVDLNGKNTGITTWWNGNKTPRATADSYFHFLFKYKGCDPYNITICTAYEGDDCYYEKYNKEPKELKKYYKWASVFTTAKTVNDNLLITSGDNREYTTLYDSDAPVAYTDKPGYYHGVGGYIWNSFALLNNSDNSGYVYVGTRCVDGNGNIGNPSNNQYYYLEAKNNELKFNLMNAANATAKYSTDKEMYDIYTYTFKVKTPFGNIISAEKKWSEAYLDVAIQQSHLPEGIFRKYCNIVGFYKDEALTQEITTYGQADSYEIYVKYAVSGMPFTSIIPSDSYDDDTWAAATWYELTDKDNTIDKKIKWNGDPTNNFQNNGPSTPYEKESEYAFIGDPYELQVVLRSQTSGSTPYYLGSTFGLSRTEDVSYGKSYEFFEHAASQILTFNVSGLKGDEKIKVTTGGTDASQITTISPDHSSVTAESSTSQTYTVTLAASGGTARTMTITIQEYDTDGTTPLGSPTVITIHQSKAGYSWEIPADDTDGSILLRKFNDEGHWYWNTSGTNQNISYSTSDATRVKVMPLTNLNYTFKVVDLSGRVAIQAIEALPPFTKLNGYASIPASIRSPFLADETVTFYDRYEDRNDDGVVDRLDWHNDKEGTSEQTALTELLGTSSDVYVSYTTSRLSSKNIQLIYTQQFNVKLNNEYIYWDSSTGKILSKASPTTAELEEYKYLWHLRGRDPYCMRIDNVGASVDHTEPQINVKLYYPVGDGTSYTENVNNGMFVRVGDDGIWDNDKELKFIADRDQASRFIAMMSNNIGVYEVLGATGTTDQYRIGRASTAGVETKIYANSTYAHGDDELRFELFGSVEVTYTLIDRAGNELIEVKSKNPRLALPSEYVSPLVTDYYYYKEKADANAYRTAGTVGTRITEIDQDTDGHIWVVYDESTFGFGSSHQYLLKFLNGKSYKLEDGADKLTNTKIQAMYPYFNGDGNLNIYGEPMKEEQMGGGSSTRPRWVWYMESSNNDPYHVKIRSRQSISFNGTHNAYIQTQAVHFNQDANANTQHIITGGNFPGITSVAATEYMILGSKGRYKLLTTNKVAADLNGDGDTSGDGENERRYVTSFEQYWKTYNMIKQYVLGLDNDDLDDPECDDAFSDDPATYVVPADKRAELKTKLGSGTGNLEINDEDDLNYVDGCSWHSYEAVANAVRWNGFNDSESGHNSKKVERLEHWFQTFDMGNGEFDIETANIPSVLVLLDRHGWEIMRKPIPTGNDDADAPTKLAALRAYDSPMVKEYKFYSNATKVSNCHKYELRMQNGKERDTISVNGRRFTTTSLATLPSYVADRDLFVTYTVKEEYDKSYTYTLNYTKNADGSYTINTETGTPSAFIVLQNHQYASDNGASSIQKTTAPSNLSNEIISDDGKTEESKTFKQNTLWYVQPNLDIDDEMGIPWPWSLASSGSNSHGKEETKVLYKDKTGFDPYNLQLKNVSTNKFFTTHMTDSKLTEGAYVGIYSGDGGSLNVTLGEKSDGFVATSESYDHSHLKITNQTFMAVQDVNGNMQIMPRFDHNTRIDAFATLEEPKRHALAGVDDESPGEQTTFMVLPVVYDYHITDNDGLVAMRYKTGGEFYPSMPEHFKSPLAKNFKYYFGHAVYTTAESKESDYSAAAEGFKKTATNESNMHTQAMALITLGEYYFRIGSSDYTYKKVTVTKGNTTSTSDGIYKEIKDKTDISDREITSSFAAVGIRTSSNIYIRYEYDESADAEHDNILQGRWMTVSLGNNSGNPQWVYYNGTLNTGSAGLYTNTKPTTDPDNLKDEHQWHWKFLASPMVETSERYKAPDPYAVEIYNRDANKAEADMATAVSVDGVNRFVILSHPDGDYALAKASDVLTSYSFLNGNGITAHDAGTPESAKIVVDGDFSASNGEISDDARVIFSNDITHTYVYRVITNAMHLAAYESQSEDVAITTGYEPFIPEAIQTPLLNLEDYIYYGTASEEAGVYRIDTESQLQSMFGLYEDVVYVRYPAFDVDKTPYLVPNKRNNTGTGHVAVDGDSNPVAIDITGKLPYNIIWYDDNMMAASSSTISDEGSQQLTGTSQYVWYFEGSDPYDIKIKKTTNKYVDGTGELNATAKSFMLLKKDDYDYGIFAETGNQTYMLSFVDNDSNPSTAPIVSLSTSDPNKFILFALSTHQLIYHLVIAKTCADKDHPNTDEFVDIPYSESNEPRDLNYEEGTYKLRIFGTTQRDLTSVNDGAGTHYVGEKYQLGHTYMGQTYCKDVGQISIGDELEVPSEFARPNCEYFYYIDNIQTRAETPATYQKDAASESAMETDAALLSEGAYYYYNVNSGSAYYRAHKESSDAIIVECTEVDYNNAWQDDKGLNNQY